MSEAADRMQQRWPEVRALFERALTVPTAERAAFVRARADEWLAERVLQMLEGEPTQPPDTELNAPSGADSRALLPTHPNMDDYRIVRQLGQGGMGVVFLAEQTQPRRWVAIKMLSGSVTEQTVARFRREADLLARLSHPGIAQIYELGHDREGTPFLVMEYAEGRHLDEYARALDRAGCLRLLARIADAVEHAHSRGVVHRDLKPSNILVGADGQPKILDFGIGFLFDASESLTATGAVLGTPAYMSPEQALGRQDVDARADVYALGAMGYELLAGRVPLPVVGLTALQAVQRVANETPVSIGRVDAALRGDLEVIIDTALAREPSLRYPSAGAFADELRRYLEREPIRARRASRWQRISLFARRNPVQVGLALGIVLSLLIGTVVSLRYANSANLERNRALAETRRAEAALAHARSTLDALNQVFSAGNPTVAGTPDLKFREALASAAAQLGAAPAATRAEVLFAVAQAQLALGDNVAAAAGLDQVQALATETGNLPLLRRAGLRRAQQRVYTESARTSIVYVDQVLAQAGGDPLIDAGLYTLASAAHWANGSERSARRALDRAIALLPDVVDPGDRRLAAEIESYLLYARAQQLSGSENGEALLPALVADMDTALPRVSHLLGDEHPNTILLRIARAAMAHHETEGEAWAPALIEELPLSQARYGLAHPAVLARIDAATSFLIMSTSLRLKLTPIALTSLRAIPLDSRFRLRQTIALARDKDDRAVLADIRALAAAQCAPTNTLDFDCVGVEARLAGTEIRLGNRAGIDRLRALVDRSDTTHDLTLRSETRQYLAMAYADLGDRANAVSAMDQALPMLEADPELAPAGLDRLMLSRAEIYFPDHCDRVLALLAPREARLRAQPLVLQDVLSYYLSSCEVLTGGDTARALARIDAEWQTAQTGASVIEAKAVIADAYLLIYDHLGQDAEFEHWARVFGEMLDTGFYSREYPFERRPHLIRALKLLGTSADELRRRK